MLRPFYSDAKKAENVSFFFFFFFFVTLFISTRFSKSIFMFPQAIIFYCFFVEAPGQLPGLPRPLKFDPALRKFAFSAIERDIWTFHNKSVLSLLRRLSTWRYPHLLLSAGAHSTAPAAVDWYLLQTQRSPCYCRSTGQTDGRTVSITQTLNVQ